METSNRDPYLALRHPGYRRYITAHFLSNVGRQALVASLMWQIYQWTHSATALGLVGLANVLPLLLLALPAGVLADRLDRRLIIRRAMIASAGLSVALVLVTHFHGSIPDAAPLRAANRGLAALAAVFERQVDPRTLDFSNPSLPLVYLLVFAHAIVRVLANPARAAIIPQLLPAPALPNAVTWNASLFELSTVIGPAAGGALVASVGYVAVYSIDVATCLLLAGVAGSVRLEQAHAAAGAEVGALEGVRFIGRREPILAAMTLDLFAVVLGGVMALLPIYADAILGVGAAGFGVLRAAPAIGAALTAFVTSHLPPFRRPGAVMLWTVAGFGLATCLFAASSNYLLSLFALFLTGMFDNVSVVIRHTMIQLLTPDRLRGRVVAVNQMFIGCSNELASLRAGLMAALLGPVAAAAIGGLGIFAVTVFTRYRWPRLLDVAPLHTLTAEDSDPEI